MLAAGQFQPAPSTQRRRKELLPPPPLRGSQGRARKAEKGGNRAGFPGGGVDTEVLDLVKGSLLIKRRLLVLLFVEHIPVVLNFFEVVVRAFFEQLVAFPDGVFKVADLVFVGANLLLHGYDLRLQLVLLPPYHLDALQLQL